jgi:23S rRNA (cytosine1962-C5)-methyltransferase
VAFALLDQPWLEQRVLVDEPELLVVDKPPGIVVHGGDERLPGDVVTRLAERSRRLGADPYLGVHQRLDKAASGVLAFSRDRELGISIARDVTGHAARRLYLAAVVDPGLPDAGRLEHQLEMGRDGTHRVVARGGKPARSSFRVLERGSGRALLELRLETGRTHQLRVQLSAVGAPIAGDPLYGGERAERLLLHAHELELPSLGRSFRAPAPPRIAGWVRGEPPAIPAAAGLALQLSDAACMRWPLASTGDAYRWVNELGDGLPGVTVDRYADWAVLSVSSDEAFARRAELAAALADLGARGVYLKIRTRADLRRVDPRELAPPEPLVGEPAPETLWVSEGALRLGVSLGDGLSTGLFLDQRDNRALVTSLAGGARVLNLFAYTCSFSVAAALGGAGRVVSVDLSRRALERGRESFRENGLDPERYGFVRADVLEWLSRARRRGDRFDLIVLDPPSFGTGARGTFDMARGYRSAAAEALSLLPPGGRLLAVTNHRKTSRERLRKLLHDALRDAGRQAAQMKDLGSPLDCPPSPDGPHPSKSVLVVSS